MSNTFPKLHNAMWPGIVGKGSPDAEPFISLDRMLDLTKSTTINGQHFDGVDLFLFDPHVNIDLSEDDVKKIADKIAGHGLSVGSLVAPVWPGTVGDSAMGGPGGNRCRSTWRTVGRRRGNLLGRNALVEKHG